MDQVFPGDKLVDEAAERPASSGLHEASRFVYVVNSAYFDGASRPRPSRFTSRVKASKEICPEPASLSPGWPGKPPPAALCLCLAAASSEVPPLSASPPGWPP